MKAVILAVSLFLLLSFSVASAQLTKITVGYSAIAAGHLPAWVAKEVGIFAKNGLDNAARLFKSRNHGNDGVSIAADSNKSAGWPGDRECQSQGRRYSDDCWGIRDHGVVAHDSLRD